MRSIIPSRVFPILIALLAAAALADMPPREQPSPPPPPGGPHDFRAGKGRAEKRIPPPVEHFMRILQEEDNEEYERLQELRESDREAFRAELRERLSRARRKTFGAGDRRYGRGQIDSDDPGDRFRHPHDNARQQQGRNLELQQMARKYRAADEGEKDVIRAKIRVELEEIFDEYQQRRMDRLERLETKIEQMRKMIREQGGKRESVIDRQMELLLRQSK